MLPQLQVRQLTGETGLVLFQRVFHDGDAGVAPSPWRSWRSWPHLDLAMDQGVDGMSALHWAVGQDLNITPWWDLSHGTNNDWKSMLRSADLWSFWLLYMRVMNCSAGPQSQDTRWFDLSSAWEEMLRLQPEECPLFLAKADRLMAERSGPSSTVGAGDDLSPLHALREQLRDEGPPLYVEWVILVRFWDSPRRASEMLKRWQTDLLNREYLALESGALTGKVAERIAIREPSGAATVGRETTAAGTLHAGERALRNACSNAVVLSVGLLANPDNERFVRFILVAGQFTEQWHGSQNKVLRSVSDAEEWLSRQFDGTLMEHIERTLLAPASFEVLQSVRVFLPCHSADGDIGADDLNGKVVYEDEMCELFADMCTVMAERRLSRLMWVFGWLVRFGALGGSVAQRDRTVAASGVDFGAWQALQSHEPRSSSMAELLRRSVFRFQSVQQFAEVRSPGRSVNFLLLVPAPPT